MYVYKITNTVTDDFYIGKTTKTVQERWYKHQKDAQYQRNPKSILYKAVRKYGPESFRLEVLAECSSYDELNESEVRYIAELSPPYNIAKGGDGGWINDQTGKRWKVKDTSRMGKALKGKKRPAEIVIRQSGGNNYQSTHFIHTPWGTFETYREAIEAAKESRKQGRKDVLTDGQTLRKYCENDVALNPEGRRTYPEWRGKTSRELGFYRSIK